MGACVKARYRAFSEKLFHPDLGSYVSYAIIYEERDNDEQWKIAQKVQDVTDSSDTATHMVRLFNEEGLAPCHLYDVIENWLNR